jgi:hypothetical protein
VAEISEGILPREFTSPEELKGASRSVWPTPQHRDGDPRRGAVVNPETAAERFAQGKRNLTDAVALWPTPDAGVFNLSETPEQWEVRRLKMLAKGYNGNGGQPRLPVAVKMEECWATPTAQDGKNDTLPPSQLERDSIPGQLLRMELWPTATAKDADHSRRATARKEHWTSESGTTLTDATIIASGTWDGQPIPRGTSSGRLNPRWVAQLMGYPPTWAVLSGPLARVSRSTGGKNPGSSRRSK